MARKFFCALDKGSSMPKISRTLHFAIIDSLKKMDTAQLLKAQAFSHGHKFQDLIAPVAACHATLESALNEYILTANPNLKEVKKLHFKFEMATNIWCGMRQPFCAPADTITALKGLNRLRNHLVHPSRISFPELNNLYDPVINHLKLRKIDKGLISKIESRSYPDLMKLCVDSFCACVLGEISAQREYVKHLLAANNDGQKP